MAKPCVVSWHRPVSFALALWLSGNRWRRIAVRIVYPGLARALDETLAALPPDIRV